MVISKMPRWSKPLLLRLSIVNGSDPASNNLKPKDKFKSALPAREGVGDGTFTIRFAQLTWLAMSKHRSQSRLAFICDHLRFLNSSQAIKNRHGATRQRI